MTRYEMESGDGQFVVDITQAGDGYKVSVSGREYLLKLRRQPSQGSLLVELGGKPVVVSLIGATPQWVQMTVGGETLSYRRTAVLTAPSTPKAALSVEKDVIVAPMPGKVITAFVGIGEKVNAGDPLVVLESMKMEVAVRADRDAVVKGVLVREGTAVKRGQALVRLG
ncbi:MAG: hypothetical protein JRM80_09785 [Nitrososphaerota archaeon]|nr:hypothetical protein [Nitrososphaerota archaeon]